MRVAGAVAAKAFARGAATPYHIVKSMAITPPERLRIAPPDMRTADPTVADEIYAVPIQMIEEITPSRA